MKTILTFFCFLLLVCPGFAKDKQPNVLLIAVDDLNDWVGCLGGHPQARTPNIDRLASRGVLFEQAYCSAPLCNPSRTATMTGLRASTTGIWTNGDPADVRSGAISWFRDKPEFMDWVTIPQYFRQHGYTAVTGGKIFHKSQGKFSDPVSWDRQYSTKRGMPFPRNGKRLLHGMSDKMTNDYFKDWADWQPLDIPERETADRKTAEGAAAFLRRDHDKPFFLACGIFRPHLRWYAPRKYFDMHPLEKLELPVTLENDLDDLPPGGRRQTAASQAFGVIREHGEWKKAVQGYLASCSFADACVGVVLDALEESEYAEKTIVVLWGDHGYHVGEKNRISKLTLWEQGSKTPLIISTPVAEVVKTFGDQRAAGPKVLTTSAASAQGKICRQPVSLVDLYPTLVELCGLPERDGLDGRSIAPLVRNPETEWQYPAVISLRGDHAVRSQRWHYIRYAGGGEELYDAAKDPHQWKNLANDTAHAPAKAELKKWLPGKNAPHYRGNGSASSGTRQEFRQAHAPKVLTTSATKRFQKPPNVVTLYVDDLGYRDIGCYGGPVKTPVLDKLAAGGVRFTDFHSGAPTCSPSRATFLTGRQHCRTGVYSVITERLHKMHLRESETTIAEVLKENGYATAHFGKWHLGMPVNNRKNPTPGDHGFDYWFGLVNGPGPSHKDPTNFIRNGKRVGTMKGYSCQIVVDEALTWLDEKRDADDPFFLNLWFNEPHAPIAAPDEIVSQYGALDEQAAIYSGTIDNTDRAIGRLVAKLEKLGELDNTIIIYASDNGSYLQERNGELRGKKGALFEGGHRVPGIFYWKGGIPGGRVEKEPAGVVDLLPTLCGLIGIDKPGGVHLDGSDLAPLLTETATFTRHQPLFWLAEANMVMRVGDHTLFASSTAESPIDFKTADRLKEQIKEVLGDDLEKELGGLDLRSRLFNGNMKFANPEANRLKDQHRDLYYFNEAWIPELKKSGIGRVGLYDLSKDPGQQNDIAKERPELVARMKEQAAAIYRSVMADAPEWLTPEELAAAKTRNGSGTRQDFRPPHNGSPPSPKVSTTSATETPDSKIAKLLARIDKDPLPKGYDGSNHQPYVDRIMAGLKPEQRAQVGKLWKEKRRLNPDMANPGASFVRILTHVAGGVGETDPASRPSDEKTRTRSGSRQKVRPSHVPKVSAAPTSNTSRKRPNVGVEKTNIILIMADDIGYECYGAYGGTSYKTPVLDKMAKQGMLFNHAYSNPVCTPTRVKIMTGLSNVRNYASFSVLKKTEKTIGHMMQDAGYKTAIAGKWQLYGAEHYENAIREKGSLPQNMGFDRHCLWQVYKMGSRFWGPTITIDGQVKKFGDDVYGPDVYSQFLIDRMTEYKDEPFFLYYPMVLVHDPFVPTPDSANRNSKDKQKNFGDMVTYMDKLIGKIVDKTVELGIAERTLILVTGDNGTKSSIKSNMGDKVIVGGKGNTTDAGTHVALFAYQPGTIGPGQVSNDLVEFTDFTPTLAEATGATSLSPTDGQSFLPQLHGKNGNPRKTIFVYYWPRPEKGAPRIFVRNQRWKLYGNGRLVDVKNDVLEQKSLKGAEYTVIRKELQAALDRMPAEGQSLFKFD